MNKSRMRDVGGETETEGKGGARGEHEGLGCKRREMRSKRKYSVANRGLVVKKGNSLQSQEPGERGRLRGGMRRREHLPEQASFEQSQYRREGDQTKREAADADIPAARTMDTFDLKGVENRTQKARVTDAQETRQSVHQRQQIRQCGNVNIDNN